MVLARYMREIRLNLHASFRHIAPAIRHDRGGDEVRVEIPFGTFRGGGHSVTLKGAVTAIEKIREVDGSPAIGILVELRLSRHIHHGEFNGLRVARWLVVVTKRAAELFRVIPAKAATSPQSAYDALLPVAVKRALQSGHIVRRDGRVFAMRPGRAKAPDEWRTVAAKGAA